MGCLVGLLVCRYRLAGVVRGGGPVSGGKAFVPEIGGRIGPPERGGVIVAFHRQAGRTVVVAKLAHPEPRWAVWEVDENGACVPGGFYTARPERTGDVYGRKVAGMLGDCEPPAPPDRVTAAIDGPWCAFWQAGSGHLGVYRLAGIGDPADPKVRHSYRARTLPGLVAVLWSAGDLDASGNPIDRDAPAYVAAKLRTWVHDGAVPDSGL